MFRLKGILWILMLLFLSGYVLPQEKIPQSELLLNELEEIMKQSDLYTKQVRASLQTLRMVLKQKDREILKQEEDLKALRNLLENLNRIIEEQKISLNSSEDQINAEIEKAIKGAVSDVKVFYEAEILKLRKELTGWQYVGVGGILTSIIVIIGAIVSGP